MPFYDSFSTSINQPTLSASESFGLAGAQGIIGLGNTMLQNYYNKKMAQYQNDYNLEMWNRQNEYNSPKETMNRLVEAGINPRAYQQLGQFANAGQPQPAAEMDKVAELSNFQSVVRQGLENQLLSEQIKQQRVETSNLRHIKDLNESKEHLNHYQLQRVLYQTFYDAIKNGVDPRGFNEQMAELYNRMSKAGGFDELNKFVSTGKRPTNPYLLALYLKNQLVQKGINLRDLEGSMKGKELDDYVKYGIRGTSDTTNMIRGIINLVKEIF